MKHSAALLLCFAAVACALHPPLDPYDQVGDPEVLIDGGNDAIRQYVDVGAREISNALCTETEILRDEREFNMLGLIGLQAIVDHDVVLTPETDGSPWPIPVPEGDPHYGPVNVTYLHFKRTGRNPENHITPAIDGSFLYGVDEARLNVLRQTGTPFMRVDENNLPPRVGTSGIDVAGRPASEMYAVGDVRGTEQVLLTVYHALFVREHNLQAKRAVDAGAEDAFGQARKITRAVQQHIVYDELLPAYIGQYAICESAPGSTAPAQIPNVFGLIFRGHTLIANETTTSLTQYNVGALRDLYFSPQILRDANGDLAPFINAMYKTYTRRANLMMVDDLRNLLFAGQPGTPLRGHDLAALNIQRGRDTGVPTWNHVREWLGLLPDTEWSSVTSDPVLQAKLEEIYETPDACDLWVCAYAQDHLPGSSLGEVATMIVAKTMCDLRAGDPHFWTLKLSAEEQEYVQQRSMSDVVCDNTGMCSLDSTNAFLGNGSTETSGTTILVLTLTSIAALALLLFCGPQRLA